MLPQPIRARDSPAGALANGGASGPSLNPAYARCAGLKLWLGADLSVGIAVGDLARAVGDNQEQTIDLLRATVRRPARLADAVVMEQKDE
jgi:hypothetical protein